MNEVTSLSVIELTSEAVPVGWKSAAITGLWVGSPAGNGKSLLTSTQGTSLLISEVVQGSALFDSAPDYIGIPTQNTPVCDVVFFPDSIKDGYTYCGFKILQVIDDNNMIVEDPLNKANSMPQYRGYVLCSRYKPVRGLDINTVTGGDFDMYNLDGTYAQYIPSTLVLKGDLEPVILLSSSSGKPIVQITY